MKPRRCHECQECCKLLAVEEISKPSGVACSKLCRTGCSVQDSKPAVCKAFSCLWLSGVGKQRHRPDRSGVVLTVHDPENPVLVAHVSKFKPEGDELISAFSEKRVVVVVPHDGSERRFLGPRAKVREFIASSARKALALGGEG